MNNNVKESNSNDNIDLEDITNLENELNDLSENINLSEMASSYPTSDLFSGVNNDTSNDNKYSVKFNNLDSSVGQGTASTDGGDSKTWDGYGKFNEIPVDPDTTSKSSQPAMSKEEMLREKIFLFTKIRGFRKKGR